MNRAAGCFCALALACLLHGSASAQSSFELDRFRPAPLIDDGFGLAGADTPGHLRMDAQLYGDYARKPLVLGLATGGSYAVVSDQLALHAAVALGITRYLGVFIGLPVNLVMGGDDPPSGITTRLPRPEGAGLGDVQLGARGRVIGDATTLAMLAAQVSVYLPSASLNSAQHYSGDDGPGVDPKLLFQLNLKKLNLRVRANAGVRLRPRVTLPGVEVGDELTFGVGADYLQAHERIRWLAELSGASFLNNLGGKPETPLELLLGVRYQHPKGYAAGLAAGPGLNYGVGTPVFRVLATVGYTASLTTTDTDADGIPDGADACPNEQEDLDGYEDSDGCIDRDNDKDGVVDALDRCPDSAEDPDGFEDADGCPEPDNDKDGVDDGVDRCPLQAGPVSNVGCPFSEAAH